MGWCGCYNCILWVVMGDSLSLSMWAGPERFEECMSLVKEHHLYQEALALLPKKEDHYKVGRC